MSPLVLKIHDNLVKILCCFDKFIILSLFIFLRQFICLGGLTILS